jgi:hypothetical protein
MCFMHQDLMLQILLNMFNIQTLMISMLDVNKYYKHFLVDIF